MVKNILVSLWLALGFVSFAVPASAQYVIVAPPAPITERIPPAPGSGYAWMPGHYRWNGSRYVWIQGHYMRHAGRYCGGHWGFTPRRGYHWIEGRWC